MTRLGTAGAVALILGLSILPAASSLTRLCDAAGETKPGEHVEKTELHRQMEQIDEAMKKLRRTLRKPDGTAESLDLITKMQQATVAAKALVPSKAATQPAAEKDKSVAGYRKGMAALLAEMTHLEAALLDGDLAKAQESYKSLKTMEDKGHDQFMEQEEK